MQFNNPASAKNMTTLNLRKSIDRSPLRLGLPRVQPIWIIRGFLVVALALECFAFLPTPNAFGVTLPDGGYPGFNTAEGQYALAGIVNSSAAGSNNTAIGYQALYSNKTGFSNTASGFSALYFNTSGVDNAADGTFALYHNTTGGNNTAMGNYTLLSNTVGNYNTAVGSAALEYSTGANNIALGNQAGFN